MFKVFITRRLPSIAHEILSENFKVDYSDENSPLSISRLKEVAIQYDAILCTVSEKIDSHILSNCDKLKAISNYGTGLDNIDCKLAKSKGIAVYNTPDIVTNSTADLTLALLLNLVRKIDSARQFVLEDKWKSWNPEIFVGEELNDKIFGIWGFGKIGLAVARRAESFGLRIKYYNHSKITAPKIDKYVSVELKELLETSDFLSIHLPLNEKTHSIVNKEVFQSLTKRPILLNLSRGEIVDTNSLLWALKKGKIRGVALDVTSPEPISGNHQLCKLDNCIIVPHIGTATKECRLEMAKLAAENILNHFNTINE